jgi:hypothetical protein
MSHEFNSQAEHDAYVDERKKKVLYGALSWLHL